MAPLGIARHPPDGQGRWRRMLPINLPANGCSESTIQFMLQALLIADALAIAEASQRRSRDERAMVQYLGIGKKRGRMAGPVASPHLLRAAIDLAAFESPERRQLEYAIAA